MCLTPIATCTLSSTSPSPTVKGNVVPTGPPSVHIRPSHTQSGTTTVPEDYPPVAHTVGIITTYASYYKDTIPELSKTTNSTESWSLCVPIAVPNNILNPTLSSLTYMLKYATKFDNGNSTIQTDVVLSSAFVKPGIVKREDDSSKGVYMAGLGYGPRLVDDAKAVGLSTVSSVKCNGGTGQWSHYIDNQTLTPNIRIVQPGLAYLIFNTTEYPTEETARCLAIEIKASWYEDVEARKQKEAADKKAKEEAEKQAQFEAVKRAQEEAEKQRKAQEELESKIEAEVNKRIADYEQKHQTLSTPVNAPDVADDQMKQKIADAAAKHGLKACSQGYAWNKTDYGYCCAGGGHKVTWAQLGMTKEGE